MTPTPGPEQVMTRAVIAADQAGERMTAIAMDSRNDVAVGIDIRRSVEDVFDYCSDHTNEIQWNPKLRRVSKLTNDPIGVGTRYEMEFLPGQPIVSTCDRFDRPTTWALTGEDKGIASRFEGRVTPSAEGAHLTFRMQFEFRGISRLLRPFLLRRMRSALPRDIGLVKTHLEGKEE